ncbi:MAG: hypothetical protein ABI439_10505 [Rhodospirillales bacterium]
MTLVIAVTTPESIWLLADRRLTYPNSRTKDTARKIMSLEADDGVALIGYSGLGATAFGTEPSDWMSAVLRGRRLPLEQLLDVLASAIKEHIPEKLKKRRPGHIHQVLIPAFVKRKARLYTIALVASNAISDIKLEYQRQILDVTHPHSNVPPRLAIAGSGSRFFINNPLQRKLMRLVKASDRKKIRPELVADALAELNYNVHKIDKSVGPSCIVTWRFRKSGGGVQFYTGTRRESSPGIPGIGAGMDISAIAALAMQYLLPSMQPALADGVTSNNNDTKFDQALSKLPGGPDEKLI